MPWFKHRYPILITHDINQPVKIKSILKDKEASKDWLAGRECIEKCSDSSWWEWDRGSRPLYWRCKEDYLNVICDGLPWYYSSTPPHYLKPQRHEADGHIQLAIRTKLQAIREKDYVKPGKVSSLTSFFSVLKGESDIQIVYNGTKSGLNNCLWAPWFRLPTIYQYLRVVEPGTYGRYQYRQTIS